MNWKGRFVVILGAARQGTALARYLVQHGAHVLLNDRQPADALEDARQSLADLPSSQLQWVSGGHPLEILDQADLLCLSGGVPLELPLVQEAIRRDIPLSNDSQIFLEIAPCKVIGITGSAGKTTTTTLVGRMAQQAASGWRAWVGGNIGAPLISDVDEMQPGDLAVMELSSFQLEIMTRSPQVAAILNITPNHLDRHVTMLAYTAAKARILAYQGEEYTAILNRDDPGSAALQSLVKGSLVTFGKSRPEIGVGTYVHQESIMLRQDSGTLRLMPTRSIQLRGEHNLSNVLAATAIAAAAGLPVEAMRSAVESFRGVPHRLEYVRTWGGADWYNDSIATAPERSMAALRSFDEPAGPSRSIVLLAGGRDKDLPWEDFAALVRQRVRRLVVFGEAAEIIIRAMGINYPLQRCATLDEAVQAAAKLVMPGDIVLLSPGGTSFDEFSDFEERGECYKKLVMHL